MPKIGEIKKGREIGKRKYNKYIWHACIDCGKERWVILLGNRSKHLKCLSCSMIGNFCSDEKRARLRQRRGERNPCWKGGRHKTSTGYIQIYLQLDSFFYPMADKDGYVLEHRLVMAKHLNRCLLSWEVVHHKNSIKDDNQLENLELLPTGKQHLISQAIQRELAKRDKRIALLEARLTLLEAEHILLKKEVSVNSSVA